MSVVNKIDLGLRLANARRAMHYSQAAVAAHLGVSIGAIYSWERGASEPSALKLLALVALYNLDLLALAA